MQLWPLPFSVALLWGQVADSAAAGFEVYLHASGTLEIEGGGLEKELVLVIIDAAAGGGTEVIEELLLAADAWERARLEFAAATDSWMSVGLSG